MHDYIKNRTYFTKANNVIYKKLMPHQVTAIKNAQATGKFCYENPEITICEMQELVIKLKELLN